MRLGSNSIPYGADLTIRDGDVKAQVDQLNKDYNGTGISWVLSNIDRINNPEWFVHAGPGTYAICFSPS